MASTLRKGKEIKDTFNNIFQNILEYLIIFQNFPKLMK
jgi:hypothetical protein